MDVILFILLAIVLCGVIGQSIIIRDKDGKETNVNEKIKKFIKDIADKL